MTQAFSSRNRLDKEFETESDRGCAILTLCLLEESLAELFAAFLPGGDRDARHFMPKGRLSLGVANAHKLGLLTDGNVETLKLLVEIRNAFAHSVLSDLSFKSEAIRAKVARLHLPNMDAVPDVLEEIEQDPRRRYMTAADNLVFTIDFLVGRIKKLQCQDVPELKVTKAIEPQPPNNSFKPTPLRGAA